MLFDTGSCEFWIPSKACKTTRCLTHTRYTRSKTYKPYNNSKMSIQYLSGRVKGDMALETIKIGDLIVPDQVIGIADEVAIPLLDEVIWDGILGLAYPNKNLRKKKINPLFDNIITQELLKKRGERNQFSYYLGAERGAIVFGGADMRFKRSINEEFQWAPIAEKNYWTITLLDIKKYRNDNRNSSNDNEMVGNALCPSGCKSIIDTGTYLIYGPSDQLQNFLSDMSIDKCSDKYKLPNLGFIFKGVQQNGKDTAFELILTPDDYVLEFEVDGKPDCVVGIGSDNEDSGWTLGQVFLKAYYTVFDRDSESVGFVKSNPNPFNPPKFNFERKIKDFNIDNAPNLINNINNSMNNNNNIISNSNISSNININNNNNISSNINNKNISNNNNNNLIKNNNNINSNINANNNMIILKDGAIPSYTTGEEIETMFDPIEKKFLSYIKNMH